MTKDLKEIMDLKQSAPGTCQEFVAILVIIVFTAVDAKTSACFLLASLCRGPVSCPGHMAQLSAKQDWRSGLLIPGPTLLPQTGLLPDGPPPLVVTQ